MREDRKKIEGFIVIENTLDKQDDIFSAEVCNDIKNQIKSGDRIFKEFDINHPIGIIKSAEYIEGEGVKIIAEIDYPQELFDDCVMRICGSYKDYEDKDGYRIIKDIELINIGLIPKSMDVYEEE